MGDRNTYILDALVNHASIGIIIVNGQGEIILANPYVQQLFGYTEDDLPGNKIEMLIPNRFRQSHEKYRQTFSHQPTTRPMGVGLDLYGVKKDGIEFPLEISLGHYSDNGNSFVIAFITDITSRKKSDEEISRLNIVIEDKAEEQTQSLQTAMMKLEKLLDREKELNDLKSRFTLMVSHEVRTPLSTILSSAYLLEKYTTAEEQSQRNKHIKKIISSVQSLSSLLDDFLSKH